MADYEYVQQLGSKTSENVRAAQRLARQIDTDLVELIDYLRDAIAYLHSNQMFLESSHRQQTTGRLQNLIGGAERMRETLKHGAESKLEDWQAKAEHLWSEAKHYAREGMESAKNILPSTTGSSSSTSQPWSSYFDSEDWAEYFKQNPNLDAEHWKVYFRDSVIDPSRWRDALESYARSGRRGLIEWEHQFFDKVPSSGYAGLRQAGGAPTLGGSPVVTAPLTMMFGMLYFAYLFVLVRRVVNYRRKAMVHVGDGSSELLATANIGNNLKQAVEHDPKFGHIASLQHALHSLRTFTTFVPLMALYLYAMEQNKFSSGILASIHLTTALTLWAYIEHGVMRGKGLGIPVILGDVVLEMAPLAMGIGCFISALPFMLGQLEH